MGSNGPFCFQTKEIHRRQALLTFKFAWSMGWALGIHSSQAFSPPGCLCFPGDVASQHSQLQPRLPRSLCALAWKSSRCRGKISVWSQGTCSFQSCMPAGQSWTVGSCNPQYQIDSLLLYPALPPSVPSGLMEPVCSNHGLSATFSVTALNWFTFTYFFN